MAKIKFEFRDDRYYMEGSQINYTTPEAAQFDMSAEGITVTKYEELPNGRNRILSFEIEVEE